MAKITDFNKTTDDSLHFDFAAGDDFKYYSLKDIYTSVNDKDKIYQVRAIYINTKGRYGDNPVILTDGFWVNLPQHLLKDCREIRQDADIVKAINDGKVGFKIREYKTKAGQTGYSVTWVETEPILPF